MFIMYKVVYGNIFQLLSKNKIGIIIFKFFVGRELTMYYVSNPEVLCRFLIGSADLCKFPLFPLYDLLPFQQCREVLVAPLATSSPALHSYLSFV